MPTIFRQFGEVVEVTTIEKSPPKVRVSTPRERRTVFGARRSDNIRRTRQICLRRVLSAIEEYGNPLLVTLTFRGDASDAAYANDALRAFQVRLRHTFAHAQSIFVPELSPRGRVHFHGLLFNVPLSLGDSRDNRRTIPDGDERKERVLANLWGEGFVDAKKTDGSPKLGHYISKYITKGAGQVLFNAMRLLRISRGFPKEIVIRDEIAELLAKHYSQNASPFKTWTGKNLFLGQIERKTYARLPLKPNAT